MESEYLGTALATDLGNPAKKVKNSTLGGSMEEWEGGSQMGGC